MYYKELGKKFGIFIRIRVEYSKYEGLVSPAYTVLKNIIPISSVYYREYFKSANFISRLNSTIYGIRDGKQIGYDDFSDLVLHNPPYYEQQKIAKILDACDKVINLKEKLLAEKRRRKKWLLENLLDPDSGIRLPGFTGEWEEEKLSDTCHINALNLTENTNKDYGNRSRGIPYKTHVSSRIETVSARIY